MGNITIKQGTYLGQLIKNQEFKLVQGPLESRKGTYYRVRPNGTYGGDKVTISVYTDPTTTHTNDSVIPLPSNATVKTVSNKEETDDQIMERIGARFDILDEMTKASINSDVKAMIVSGPPGVGKSYGVEKQLSKANMFDTIAQQRPKYEVVKGAMTPIGLYATLFRHSTKGHVLVFDDCDAILHDELSLNILKAALDSGKRRRVHWSSDSHVLRREGIPHVFDFHASVIFITNLKFSNIRSKKLQDHLAALQSRCHYLDLTLDTMRDKILRVKQIAKTGELFKGYNLDSKTENEILDFMEEHKDKLNEMSLRMALKIADLYTVNPEKWRFLAMNTCMKYS